MLDQIISSFTATHITIMMLGYFVYSYFTKLAELREDKQKKGFIPVPQHIKSTLDGIETVAGAFAKTTDKIIDVFTKKEEETQKSTTITIPDSKDALKTALNKVDNMEEKTS